MTNDRPYRKAFPQEKAVAEKQRGVNKQFDLDVVVAFKKAFERG
jgi:HD-GYP domain-containing protein (c-di-GMP phosphodiesterase class II)